MKQDTLIRKIYLKGNPAELNTHVDSSLLTSVNGNNSANNNHTVIIGNGAGSITTNGANGTIAEPKTGNNDKKIYCPCL